MHHWSLDSFYCDILKSTSSFLKLLLSCKLSIWKGVSRACQVKSNLILFVCSLYLSLFQFDWHFLPEWWNIMARFYLCPRGQSHMGICPVDKMGKMTCGKMFCGENYLWRNILWVNKCLVGKSRVGKCYSGKYPVGNSPICQSSLGQEYFKLLSPNNGWTTVFEGNNWSGLQLPSSAHSSIWRGLPTRKSCGIFNFRKLWKWF